MISATALTLTYPDLRTATRLTASLTERTYTCVQQQLQLQLATIQCTKFAFVDARVRRAFRVLLHNAGNFAIVSDERHYFVTRRRCRQSVTQQSMSFLQAFQQAVALQQASFVLASGFAGNAIWMLHLFLSVLLWLADDVASS